MATDIRMGSMKAEYETAPGLSIGTMTFDLGWHWTVLDAVHRTCTSNISNIVWDTMLTQWSYRKPLMACKRHHDHWPWMTLNCPSSWSPYLHVKYFKNGDRYDNGVNKSRIGNHTWAIDCHHDFWPSMTLTVLDLDHRTSTSNIWNTVSDTMLDTMKIR